MLQGHPKGLFVAFFANMGERFGFYTMLAIFMLFLQAKYGLSAAKASQVYGIFMFCVYFFPLIGGLLADRVLGYGKTIGLGLVVMFIGYSLLAIPTTMNTGFPLIIAALATIALGTGFFKGNLQALVGKLYDDPKFSASRDRAFSIFYMGINIGAMFAPTAAETINNWILSKAHYSYDNRIPALANQFLKGTLADAAQYLQYAQGQDPAVTMETLGAFSTNYINVLSKSYHYGFGVACVSLIASMIIFWGFRKYYGHADYMVSGKAAAAKGAAAPSHVETLTPEQTKERLIALALVYFVVVFFWMSFHQNGVTMTYFARDYTLPSVGKMTNLWFDLFGLLPIFLAVLGGYFALRKGSSSLMRGLGAIGFVLFAVLALYRFKTYEETNPFTPQMFQHFNPFFIVALTPLVVAIFSALNSKGKEPSAPRKIGFGMLITAVGFLVLVVGSIGLSSPKTIGDTLGGTVAPTDQLVSPYWLISTYFILTIAELFLSPMGISFVSKVAPPQYKGLMQGGWFAATAIGNYLLAIVGFLWTKLPVWGTWMVLVVCCLLSATFMFGVMKRLERATKS